MQLPFPSDAAPLGTTLAKDCLVLNVWAPQHRTCKLPVLVWIYGGGFVNGGSSPAVYDGSQFAKHGLVVVSFNYRLGRFGFFAHPALTKESKGGLLGNYGYMDQIMAMKWVQRNIAAYQVGKNHGDDSGDEAGFVAMKQLLSLNPRPDGVFCCNDPIAMGVMRAILEAGLRIPGDVAVVGCGNVHYADFLRVPLASADQDSNSLGTSAANFALSLIKRKTEVAPKNLLLSANLVVRASSQR